MNEISRRMRLGMLAEELYYLKNFFIDNPKIALCFSGGVNSTYLLHAGIHYNVRIKAYYLKTPFQSQIELNRALHLAKQMHADLNVLKIDVLSDSNIIKNSSDRCYHCENKLLTVLKRQATKDGFPVLVEGSNASGNKQNCLGSMSLLKPLVRSPLKECGITKTKVRILSKKAGIVTWDEPHYTCLASCVPTGTQITAEALKCIERAEKELLSIGLTNFKLEITGRTANLQISVSQMESVVEKRENIIERLKPDFDVILLDLAGNKQ
ncbi:MAG: TIGR00268 family protein [Clostridia bacterium]|nr:TIGR00268 family protein [Clostridia bacterium]